MKLSLTHAVAFGATFLLGVTAGGITIGRIVSSSSQWRYVNENSQIKVVSSVSISEFDPRREVHLERVEYEGPGDISGRSVPQPSYMRSGPIREVEFKIKTAAGVSQATAVVFCEDRWAMKSWETVFPKRWGSDTASVLKVAVCPKE